MANCPSQILTKIERNCDGSKGGVNTKVLVIKREDVDFDNITFVAGEKNVIDTIPVLNSAKWVSYEFPKNAVNYTNEGVYDGTTNEFSYMNNHLNLAFRRMDAAKRLSLNALLLSGVVVLVEDANGTKYIMGYEEDATTDAAGFDTGAARTDANAVNVSIVDTTSMFPYQVSKTAWDAALATIA